MTQLPLPFPNSNNTNSYPENQSLDWESRMAKLVGFEEELVSSPEESTYAITTINSTPEENPELVRTKQPLSANPFAKVAVVGATTLCVVLVAGTFLAQMMNGGNQKSKNLKNTDNLTNKLLKTSLLQDQPKPEAEIETLKTKLALSEQAKAVKMAQLQLKTAQLTQPTPAKLNPAPQQPRVTQTTNPIVTPQTITPQTITPQIVTQSPPRVIIQKVPGEVRTVYVPRTVTVERVVERIVRVPQRSSQTPTQTAKAKPTQATKLALSPTPSPQPTPSQVTNNQSAAFLNPAPSTSGEIPEQDSSENQPANSPENPPQTKSVAVGTTVEAVLATALVGETSKSANDGDAANDFTTVVRLTQPLKATDDSVVLQPGTELLTQISRIGESGLVQLNVISLIMQKDGNLTKIDLPKGTIKIRSPQGRPLIAKKYPDRGRSIAGMDTGLFVLGGVAKAAELFNRPESNIIISGNSTITQNNSRPNVLTGVLEGGFSTIVPQITLRNQQAISELTSRTNIWILPAGTKVEVFINQNLQF